MTANLCLLYLGKDNPVRCDKQVPFNLKINWTWRSYYLNLLLALKDFPFHVRTGLLAQFVRPVGTTGMVAAEFQRPFRIILLLPCSNQILFLTIVTSAKEKQRC